MEIDDTGRTVNFVVGAFVLVCVSAGAIAGPYEDCILQNMKGVQAQAAAGAVMRACKEKTTPKKCREAVIRGNAEDWSKLGTPTNTPPNFVAAAEYVRQLQEQCRSECASAGYWSRTFGECSTD